MEHLVITVLGPDKLGIANELFKLIAHCGCDIAEGRINTMGTEFTANLLLTGKWSVLAKLEASLAGFEKKHDVRTLSRRTQARVSKPDKLPYSSYIIFLAQPGAIYKITQFLNEQNINTHELSINNYRAPISETPMLSLSMSFTIPADRLIADFREQFILFCDDNNFDAALEPQKS